MYLHDATSADTGTMPSAKLATSTIVVTASGAATNRGMDTTAGSTQVAPTLASNASTTAQLNWWRRWVSAPLAAQTLGSASVHWLISIAGSTSNASNSAWDYFSNVFVWTPSTGTLHAAWGVGVGDGTGVTPATTSEALLTSIGGSEAEQTLGTYACAAGDILVLEVYGKATQGMATSYTWTLDYDGTTDNSITSCAAFLVSPTTLIWLPAGFAHSQALVAA